MKTATLVADVTAHGFGHLAQVAAVLNDLGQRRPGLDFIIRTGHTAEVVANFIRHPHRLAPPPPDIGMLMTGPSRVDAARTYEAYSELHERLDEVVETEARQLAALSPDLVFSNIPYTTLLAAKAVGVPAVALCSLNWADIFEGYCAGEPGAGRYIEEMREGYQAADAFFRPAPAMPMAWHHNPVSIGPIARRAKVILRPKSLPPAEEDGGPALILVGLGGIKSDFDPNVLPVQDGFHWIIPSGKSVPDRSDCSGLDELGTSFLDLFPFCAAVLTKSGYGTFAEAAAHGTRVLFAARPDWPEAASLEPWLLAHATATAITQADLYEGSFAEPLKALLARPASPQVEPTGARDTARHLLTSWLP